MTPLWIELEGIRSFIAPRRIEFRDFALFAILGDTGAGKSSILEAIVYALYNGTTWDGKDVKELLSTGAAHMRVRFCFGLDGRSYTVSRRTPRDGAANHLLECADHPEERRDGEGAVGRYIKELLGLDRETFTKTVVLPQGEFDALLTLAPGKRARLLTEILGLGVLDDMVAALAGPRARATALRAHLQGARGRLPADPPAAITGAEAQLANTQSSLAALQGALEAVNARQVTVERLARAVTARIDDKAQLASAPSVLARLESLIEVDERLERELTEAEEYRTTAEEALRDADDQIAIRSRDGTDAPTLRAVHETLGRLIDAYAERDRDTDDATRRLANVETARSELATQASNLEGAHGSCDEARRADGAARADLDAAETTLRAAQRAAETLAAARSSAVAAKRTLEDAQGSAHHAAADCERTGSDERGAAEALSVTERALADAERTQSAAHAAQGLQPGDPCPICERALPKTFKAHAAPDLEGCQRALGVARKRLKEMQGALARAEALRDGTRQGLDCAVAANEAAAIALDEATLMARTSGLDPGSIDLDATLTPLRARAEENRTMSARTGEALQGWMGELAATTATHRSATDKWTLANAELRACEQRIALREGSISSIRGKLPARYRLDERATGEATTAMRADVENALEAASSLERLHSDAIAAAGAAAGTLRTLDSRRTKEVVALQHSAVGALAGVVNTLERRGCADAGLVSPLADASLRVAVAWAGAVTLAARSMLADLIAEDECDARRSADETAAVTAQLAEHDVSSSAALAQKRDVALQRVAIDERTLSEAKQAAIDVAALEERLGGLDPLARALDALHEALGDAKFKHFVAARKEEHLLGVATTILRRMTEERYGFGTGFRIVDRAAGQERSPQTLSGGEKFLASLALALALVEIAARSGGRFGSLFLDEGFGALDPRALDEALTELELQAAGGRMIGVITHVREVTDYIDDVLRVTKTPSGSDVSRLDRADVDALAEEAPFSRPVAASSVPRYGRSAGTCRTAARPGRHSPPR